MLLGLSACMSPGSDRWNASPPVTAAQAAVAVVTALPAAAALDGCSDETFGDDLEVDDVAIT